MSIALPSLPAGWSRTRVDRVATVNARIGWKALTAAEYQADGYAFLSTPNIKGSEIDFSNVNYISEFRYEESPELQLKTGDVLLAKDGNTLGIVNIVRELPRPATVNGSIAVIRSTGIDPSYLRHVLTSRPTQETINMLKGGMGVPHLFQWDINRLPIPLPPPDEQHRIARFLDTETSRIDRLMTLRKAQFKLLSERSKTYKHARVTESNRRTTELRELDWLGPVPAVWGAPLLNRISRFTMGTTFPHEYQGNRSGDFPFIKVGDFARADEIGRLGSAENWISHNTARKLGAKIVPAGAILYARVGAALLLNRRRITLRPSVIDDNVRAISFSEGDPRYWLNVLSLLDMGQLMNPGPVPSISEGQVSAVRVPKPPLSKQSQIADDLERYQLSQRRVEESLNAQMTLLTERRQALITAAVSGQIDVSTASGRGIEE
ncbi:restriction endonuclease subunit S [Streptomyces prunicolor]|uniref:restriction endonuclease subunit S n=1 Tax=Streptomyces prunicolor TaxID=67348 RepID=UPI00344451E8